MKPLHEAGYPSSVRENQMTRYTWILFLLLISAGCVHVPVSSNIAVDDRLPAASPLEPGDVLLVSGQNADPPDRNAAVDYFTAGCQGAFHVNTIGELVKTILKINPQPGRFAVRHVMEAKNTASDGATTGANSILGRLDLTREMVSRDHLRYAVHVKESFEVGIHAPLYVSPFGVASCSNKTVLEAGVWDLPDERFLGSFTVTAEGEYTVTAYLFHVIVFPDTQQDAAERLAREIVARLAGLKPLEDKDD